MAGIPVVAVGLNGSARIGMPQTLTALTCHRVWLRVLSGGRGKSGKSVDPHWSWARPVALNNWLLSTSSGERVAERPISVISAGLSPWQVMEAELRTLTEGEHLPDLPSGQTAQNDAESKIGFTLQGVARDMDDSHVVKPVLKRPWISYFVRGAAGSDVPVCSCTAVIIVSAACVGSSASQ
jgi:hypothetical protein